MANKWDERKKAQEDEYFVKKERELLANLKAKQEAETKTSLQKTCYMHCPKCGAPLKARPAKCRCIPCTGRSQSFGSFAPLKARSFQKIEIDQCTGCNGIWLDAGELEQVAGKDESSWLGKFWQKNG